MVEKGPFFRISAHFRTEIKIKACFFNFRTFHFRTLISVPKGVKNGDFRPSAEFFFSVHPFFMVIRRKKGSKKGIKNLLMKRSKGTSMVLCSMSSHNKMAFITLYLRVCTLWFQISEAFDNKTLFIPCTYDGNSTSDTEGLLVVVWLWIGNKLVCASLLKALGAFSRWSSHATVSTTVFITWYMTIVDKLVQRLGLVTVCTSLHFG